MSVRWLAPTEMQEALELLAAPGGEGLVVLAGGTDLWPKWTAEGRRPVEVLSLHRLRALRAIEREEGDLLRIGALCTHRDLATSSLVREACPALAGAAATVGAVQVQNRGTLGGNVVNASPAADLPPALVAAGASVELASLRGRRCVPIDEFFTAYRMTVRRNDELVVAVRVPILPPCARERFAKVGTRRAQAISKVVGACRLELDEGRIVVKAGVAFGSVAPTVLRLIALEQWLVGRAVDEETAQMAAAQAADAVHPIDDLRSTAAYRRHVVSRLVSRWIVESA